MITTNKVPMQHPMLKDREGKPKIQYINKLTVDSGKAAKMGYVPVPKPEAPPQSTAPVPVFNPEPVQYNEPQAVQDEPIKKKRTRKPKTNQE